MSTQERPEERNPIEDLLRMDRIPHIWCPGCGIGTVVSSFADALHKSELDLNKVAIVSGIGCTGRVAGYVKLDSFHSTHGRAIPFATGLKLANPELKVVVFSGDGDIAGIGGNHFIHAARRNMDLTIICVNNFNYAMTGGQVAATTPIMANLSTAPFGNFEYPFNLAYLADACGATYVARWTAAHPIPLSKTIAEAISHEGFAFVEIIAQCPTQAGRLMYGISDPAAMLEFLKGKTIPAGTARKLSEEERKGKFIIGKLFHDSEKTEFSKRYYQMAASSGKDD